MFFSVIVPLYNAENYIGRCIESVLIQEETDFELVIVNDGSNDKSKEIVENYMIQDERIRLINIKNSGSFHARCEAVSQAKGKYAVFLDSDDTFKKNTLKRLKRELEFFEIDIIIYRAEAIDVNGRVTEFLPLFENGKLFNKDNKDELYRALLRGESCINVMWIKAIKLECFDLKICINTPRISVSDDFLYSLGPITNANAIKYIEDVLYEYRYNSESIMRNFQPGVYGGIKYVYSQLLNYMSKWEMSSNNDMLLFYNKFVSAISGISLYSKSSLRGKRKEYFKTLRQMQQDILFNDVYNKAFKQIKFKYKVPFFLVKHKCFMLLFVLNHIVKRLRKITRL